MGFINSGGLTTLYSYYEYGGGGSRLPLCRQVVGLLVWRVCELYYVINFGQSGNEKRLVIAGMY